MPEFAESTPEEIDEFWDEWLIYRWAGKRNSGGVFEPSIDYIEAINNVPDSKLKVFMELDKVYGKMERQYIKQKTAKDNKGNS